MRRLLLLAPFALLLMRADPAHAWADTGHRMVAAVALDALPADLPGFLRSRENRWRLIELSREPDRSKGAGQPHAADLDPAHFVDIDDAGKVLGGPSIDALPPNRETYEAALQAVKQNSWDAGWLPYALVEGWQQLVKDFAYWRAARVGERKGKTSAERAWFAQDRKLREDLIVRDLGYWSHFVGDGSQPLHATVHFNGWGDYPNPAGYTKDRIHAPFEGRFVHDNADRAAVKAQVPAYAPCNCTVQEATVRYLKTAQSKVEPLYQLWGQGGFQGRDPRGAAFVNERIAAGATQLRDYVADAWRASGDAVVGYPAAKVSEIERTGQAPYDTIYGRE